MIKNMLVITLHWSQSYFSSILNRALYPFLFILIFFACSTANMDSDLKVNFNGKYGQVEIGGKFVGAEFHKSRPLPSRISFYYPVANSIDFSKDYWQRYRSFPFTILLKTGSKEDTLGKIPYPYQYTPYSVQFDNVEKNLKATFSYDVCDDLPVIVIRIVLKNVSGNERTIALKTLLQSSLRTSHSYILKNYARILYENNNAIASIVFNDVETDSAVVFIANAGELPIEEVSPPVQYVNDPGLQFTYHKNLESGEQFQIIQLLGMCRQNESKQVINRSLQYWKNSVSKNKNRILNYSFNKSYFYVADTALQQTMYWSKALLASNIHYIDGNYIPMPCPAEYNFFFTHDLLLTGLGAMYFDPDFIKDGFHFLRSLTKDDSVLAHAYYWKDTQFVTEYCNSDNWNHMWFIIAASSYLKHSMDKATLELLFPILEKSLQMMLENKGEDNLMYAGRPDWWDIGHVYGARSYNTILMYKALQDYVYISSNLGKYNESLTDYLKLAECMKKQCVAKFWDEKSNYLLNMIDEQTVDHHCYSGSLVAVFFDLLDEEKKTRLLKTAENVLLDEKIGIRNAMPPDFHELIPVYNFSGMEAGKPYFYFNGGVWPQGNVWYALGLLNNNQVDEANTVMRKYLTLQGIQDSPNGQPSFYEFRITDPHSLRYGEIDKPTFLWAAGWYLYALYQLAGLRENSWNIFFSPNLPAGFEKSEYDLSIFGELCRIKWHGKGKYFQQIKIDGQIKYSAVIISPAKSIELKRGKPEAPYLSAANCRINKVHYQTFEKKFTIEYSGIVNQNVQLGIISPFKLKESELIGSDVLNTLDEFESVGVYTYELNMKTSGMNNELVFHFN